MKRKKVTWIKNKNGCMECNSHATSNKYPQMYKNRKTILVHRHIYEECFGEIPKGMVIRHKCDNPLCINPEHLELGTQTDNINDMLSRGRKAKTNGENNGNAKLTKEQVLEIRKSTLSTRKIAKIYKVSQSTIRDIKSNKTWTKFY